MQSAQPTPVDVFLRTHPDRGGLRVQVTCGGGRFPVAGAQVVISRAHILPGRHRRLRYPIRHPPARPALCLVSSLGHRRPQRAGLSGVGTASHVPAGGWPDGDGIRRSGDHPAGDAGASGVRKERA